MSLTEFWLFLWNGACALCLSVWLIYVKENRRRQSLQSCLHGFCGHQVTGKSGQPFSGAAFFLVFEGVRLSPLKAMSWFLVGCTDLAACLLLTHSSCKISLKNTKHGQYITILLSTGNDTCWKSILPNSEHCKCNN